MLSPAPGEYKHALGDPMNQYTYNSRLLLHASHLITQLLRIEHMRMHAHK